MTSGVGMIQNLNVWVCLDLCWLVLDLRCLGLYFRVCPLTWVCFLGFGSRQVWDVWVFGFYVSLKVLLGFMFFDFG